jgi:hypothetical protein
MGEDPLMRDELSRRELLETAALTIALTPLVGSLLAACSRSSEPTAQEAPSAPATQPSPAPQAAAKPEPAERQAATGEGTAPAPAPADASGGATETELITEVPAMAALVQSLHYTNKSEKPDQHCSLCLFFTPRANDRGKCQLFAQGLVSAGGWCASFQPRQKA